MHKIVVVVVVVGVALAVAAKCSSVVRARRSSRVIEFNLVERRNSSSTEKGDTRRNLPLSNLITLSRPLKLEKYYYDWKNYYCYCKLTRSTF